MHQIHSLALISLLLIAGGLLQAQTPYTPEKLTEEDYYQAELSLSYHTASLVAGGSVRPTWIDDHRFWYLHQTGEGTEFILVDVSERSRQRAFDHAALAGALADATGRQIDASDLAIRNLEFAADRIYFEYRNERFAFDPQKAVCTREGTVSRSDRNAVIAPDGKKAAFIRDHNLWLRDLQTGTERPLTTDGIPDFGYATDNAGWTQSDRPVLLWSSDSKKIATFQHDGRGVGEMHLVTTNVGHPELKSWKYPLPEDSVIFRVHRVIIDLENDKVVRLQMPPDQHRSSITDHIASGGQLADAMWSADGKHLAFLSNSRDHKQAILRVADAATGTVRDILEETEETFFESGYRTSNWRFLPESNELIWFSQRTDWGHLYLYDLENGQLKNTITSGDWNVLQVRHIDAGNRRIYFTGAGREAGDPYFQYFYRVNMDGSGLELLTPDSANHEITLAPDASYFIDQASTPVSPPVTVVRDRTGKVILPLERADISRLLAAGWQPPMPVTVKARDGQTDLYGLLFKPRNFDPEKQYPIINYIYPGPQTGSVGSRSFSPSRRDNQAIADLGFIVVAIDAMGTPLRSKSFHAAYYGNMGDNGLPDQVTAMQQLAARYPWIDLDRAGIYGHSGGGFASTAAMLRYPDFFKVAVSSAGNHDNRNYEDDWGEKWQGLLTQNPDGSTNYDNQANQLLAENLKGKLLLAHGTMDDNVPYYNTLLVADALIAANKDFDLLMFPNRRHGFGNEPYMMRKRWDYFVQHLLGATPPKQYSFKFAEPRP